MSTITSVLLTVPGCPDAGLSPNARLHWRRKAKLIADARRTAWYAARDAVGVRSGSVFTGPVSVRIVIFWGKGRKLADADNALSMCKSLIDGFTGVLWVDDKHCRFEPVEQRRDPRGVGYVSVEVIQR